MKRLFKWLGGILAVLIILAGVAFAHVWYFKPAKIDWLYTRTFAKFALQQPELMTSLRMLDSTGLDWYNDELADVSPAAREAYGDFFADEYAVFKRYDRADYEGQALLSYDIWDYFMGMNMRGREWEGYDFPVTQLSGVQTGLPNFMAETHLIDDVEDAENYITRLTLFPVKIGQVIETMQEGESNGIIPPDFAVEKALAQMGEFRDVPADENLLYVSLGRKLDEAGIDGETRDDLLARALAAIEAQVYPAFDDLIAHTTSLQSRATSSDGVWRLPRGDEYYAYQIKQHTTTDMSADRIHQLGLSEVARIESEMDAILREIGLTEGSVGERMTQLNERPDQLYPDTDAGREQIIADYQIIIDEIDAQMGDYFNLRPSSGVVVKRVPEFSEKGAPGAYYQGPSLDGARKGTFFANLYDIKATPKFGMRTLAYHEAVPGHHFQITIMQELEGLPLFRNLLPFTAFSEGWALYSEQLAWEAGFQDDPLDNLGRLQGEMFRAVRLVVDSGMHAKRWSRERAIDYMLEKTGMAESDVITEIERYLVNPGQALAYKVGMLKILELRQRAKDELGDDFDLKAFHDQVIGNGALPMTLLERVVDEWIADVKGGSVT